MSQGARRPVSNVEGVDERSKRIQRRFEWPVLAAALLVIPVIAVEETHPGEPWEAIAEVANWAIWLLFLAEVVTMLAVVPSRRAWLRGHVLDVAIVVLTPPVLPPGLQAARVFRLARLLRLARGFVAIRRLFTPEGVRYAAMTTAFLVLIAGAAFAAIEKHEHEPALSAWDGIYWALSTVTTVGYGDISPVTDGGRVIAAAVMIAGIGFVAVITGAVAERFLAASREAQQAEQTLAREVAELRGRVEQLES
jgi:voltage-gated potassium channel